MVKSLIITAIMVGAVYFILKKLTVYRCPRCASIHITRLKEHNYKSSETIYFCTKCGTAFTRKKPLN